MTNRRSGLSGKGGGPGTGPGSTDPGQARRGSRWE
jgi:hypothetical protein